MKFGRGVGGDVVNRIKSARNRIWIVSPFISEKYVRLLKSKCEEGVDVRIITVSKINLDCARRPRKFAHAKIYIIDDSGFYGSMNLTDDGVNRNYEIIAHVKPEELLELEREFLKLWDSSLPIKEDHICEEAFFEKAWERKFPSTTLRYDVKRAGDRFYVTTYGELICLSTNGKVLWRVPITSPGGYDYFRVKDYGDYLLVYRYYSSKGYKSATDCVRVYLVRSDGVIESSFDYTGIGPWAVYYDPQEKVIGILEKVEDGYEIVGLDTSGNRIEDYTGKKDVMFFLPSVVRGDGTVELKIPSGDMFRVSPEAKKIAVLTLLGRENKRTLTPQGKDTIVNVKVYDVDSKSLYKESKVNLGRTSLQDFAIDDEGKAYLLTKDSVYIIEDDIQKITIVDREPMFESPKKSISIQYPGSTYTHYYYYEKSESNCQKIVLFGDLIIIVLVDILDYTNEYRSARHTYWIIHALIYSKNDFKLFQVLRSIVKEEHLLKIPQIFPFDDGFMVCYPKKIEYFRKVDLRPKVEDFMNFLQSVAPILRIDPENYRQTISRLCEEGSERLVSYIEAEKQNLMQELQIKRSEIEKELAEIVSKIERVVRSGYNTKKVKDLLNLAKDTLKNVDENLLEAEDKLEILKKVIQKSDTDPALSVDVEVEKVKSDRLCRAILKLRTDSELGVIAKIKGVKGNVEPHFEKRPVEVCPETMTEIFLELREEPPLPVTIEVEYKYFEKVGVIDKPFLII